jgi:translation initiation factor 2 alpha subunit (eIF-2alpha)
MSNFSVRFNEKIFNLKWYKNVIPQKDDIVICRVEKNKDCVDVSILDYGGIEGKIQGQEISRKRISSIQSIIKVGEIRPFRVHNISRHSDVDPSIKLSDLTPDQVDIDLSNRNVGDASDIECVEKYYRLISIMHIWLKNIANSRSYKNGKSLNLTDSVEFVADIKKDSSILSNIKTTASVSNLIDVVLDPISDKTEMGKQTDLTETTNLDISGAVEKRSIPYSSDVWEQVMELTLWKDLDDEDYDIYDLFMDIKTKKITIQEAFPELATSDIIIGMYPIEEHDINNLADLIDHFINYSVSIKIQLKLTSWSLNSLEQIKSIISAILKAPCEKYPEANITYSSVVLNSPTYDFVIKSANKAVMDELYSTGSTVDESILGNILNDILATYDDIHYELNIEREDSL